MSVFSDIEKQAIDALNAKDEEQAREIFEIAIRLLVRCQKRYNLSGLISSKDGAGRYNISTLSPNEIAICVVDVGQALYWHEGGRRALKRHGAEEHPGLGAMKPQ